MPSAKAKRPTEPVSVQPPSPTILALDDPTLPAPASPSLTPPASSSSATFPRPNRLRSRTSTMTNIYVPPLPPVMSRENSAEDVHEHHPYSTAPSMLQVPVPSAGQGIGRRASKSVSGAQPEIVLTPSKPQYWTPQTHQTPTFTPTSPETDMRNIVKRRTSTPSLHNQFSRGEEQEDDDGLRAQFLSQDKPGQQRELASRARSTSTSVVVPQTQDLTENSVIAGKPIRPSLHSSLTQQPPPPPAWSPAPYPIAGPSRYDEAPPPGYLASAYNYTSHLVNYVRPTTFAHHSYDHPESSEADESEKGQIGSEDETLESETRMSEESARRGRYWVYGSEDSNPNYFDLPPTPPESSEFQTFSAALPNSDYLPTPALSTRSLARGDSKRNKLRRAFRRARQSSGSSEGGENGWWSTVLSKVGGGSEGRGKMGEVLKELGWTVGALVGIFVVSLGIVVWLVKSIPITTMRHLPSSTTDVQLLSAEIRAYMASSAYGWWHTVGVLTFVGCWKHSWSVPGAVVLNILVGSLLEPIPALILLTIITASGSLGAYMLSRPLAPLISVLFPKPLALVRAALTPESIPSPVSYPGEKITPIAVSSDPSEKPIGDAADSEPTAIWRRLLVMRAMGFVPWSGMNVACGVVGVDWRVFWLTTAAGSVSWSYVTASVGNILSRLQVPPAAAVGQVGEAVEGEMAGESLTSLLRDPVLITKLVLLSGLTLIPVILKKRSPQASSASSSPSSSPRPNAFDLSPIPTPSTAHPISSPRPINPKINTLRLSSSSSSLENAPMSPLSTSLAKFTPTPRIFDLLSFGRLVVRQGGRGAVSGVRAVGSGVKGVGRSLGLS
ncbi:hypothetical protein I350_00084 [Cryptococcus amylolentus CBS 6273]|uniref:Uncharacterized protein n=1 Tax=Cryptococcus amylolentus CBS 6273 TaxID=1296118 RepID=A0A1E3KDX9_9TREE|nr:hypothetical protein I350_00084 [Cryptococcus amylolentus CBS 6273]